MRKLTGFFLNRPLTVHLIVLGAVVFGIYTMTQMRRESFPSITVKSVFISTVYPGASARDVEINVTIPIEEALRETDGVRRVLSTSQVAISFVEARADEDYTLEDLYRLRSDIESKINQIKDFPGDLENRPVISLFTNKDVPIIELAFSGPPVKVREAVIRAERRLRRLPDVAAL